MANRTVKDARSIHGTNPQYLVEKIIRTRIYDSKYWKQECFACTAEILVDKGMELRYIGGIYGGNVKPTPFLCLTLKMLQIQPEKDIIVEFIKQDEWKYVRALGAFYMRLVYPSIDCFKYLEPLLNDYRKLRIMNRNGQFELSHMDEYIDGLLRDERVCDIMLPRIQKRWVHETANELETRVSLLMDDLDDLESDSEEEDFPPSPPITPPRRGERERGGDRDEKTTRDDRHSRHSPHRERRSDRDRHREREKRHRSRSKERGGRDEDVDRKRRKSSRERRHKSPGHEERRRERKEKERKHRDREGREHRHHGERGEREHRDRGERKERERGRDKEKRRHHRDRDHKSSKNYDDEDPDIAEANQLRARLGLPPLRL